MKITNLTMINMINSLKPFMDKKLPQRISYAITRNIVVATMEYQIYETQLRKILEEYSSYVIKDGSGNPKMDKIGVPVVEDSVRDEYFEKIADLLNFEIELNVCTINEGAFDYDDKGKYDLLSPNEIMLLQSILCPE